MSVAVGSELLIPASQTTTSSITLCNAISVQIYCFSNSLLKKTLAKLWVVRAESRAYCSEAGSQAMSQIKQFPLKQWLK